MGGWEAITALSNCELYFDRRDEVLVIDRFLDVRLPFAISYLVQQDASSDV